MDKKDSILKELEEKLKKCQEEKDDYLNGWKRAKADFLNYKKEEVERIGELAKYGNVEFILRLLPILDNFEIAISQIEKEANDQIVKGFFQIKKQLDDFLSEEGVEQIESIGKRFDPNFHEVVEELEVKDKEPGQIVEEIQKGYKINGRILRPTKVKIVK